MWDSWYEDEAESLLEIDKVGDDLKSRSARSGMLANALTEPMDVELECDELCYELLLLCCPACVI